MVKNKWKSCKIQVCSALREELEIHHKKRVEEVDLKMAKMPKMSITSKGPSKAVSKAGCRIIIGNLFRLVWWTLVTKESDHVMIVWGFFVDFFGDFSSISSLLSRRTTRSRQFGASTRSQASLPSSSRQDCGQALRKRWLGLVLSWAIVSSAHLSQLQIRRHRFEFWQDLFWGNPESIWIN